MSVGSMSLLTSTRQGFDEFMNLVIDDAVEVQLPTKDNSGKRRQLGELNFQFVQTSS